MVYSSPPCNHSSIHHFFQLRGFLFNFFHSQFEYKHHRLIEVEHRLLKYMSVVEIHQDFLKLAIFCRTWYPTKMNLSLSVIQTFLFRGLYKRKLTPRKIKVVKIKISKITAKNPNPRLFPIELISSFKVSSRRYLGPYFLSSQLIHTIAVAMGSSNFTPLPMKQLYYIMLARRLFPQTSNTIINVRIFDVTS